MDSEKLSYFCIGGILSVLMVMVLQETQKLEARNAYQQGIIENQRQWLEYEKGEKW
ncbi:MAG: hypothetical protein ACRCU2_00115 [Planktothrix sp.]